MGQNQKSHLFGFSTIFFLATHVAGVLLTLRRGTTAGSAPIQPAPDPTRLPFDSTRLETRTKPRYAAARRASANSAPLLSRYCAAATFLRPTALGLFGFSTLPQPTSRPTRSASFACRSQPLAGRVQVSETAGEHREDGKRNGCSRAREREKGIRSQRRFGGLSRIERHSLSLSLFARDFALTEALEGRRRQGKITTDKFPGKLFGCFVASLEI